MTSATPAPARAVAAASYPVPENEPARLRAVETYVRARAFVRADLIRGTAFLLKVPVAMIALVEEDRVRVLSRHGGDVRSVPRGVAFSSHTILSDRVMVIPDTHADPRFSNNPLTRREPPVRFYAGAPLITRDGYAIAALCVMDWSPRGFSEESATALAGMALRVMNELDLCLTGRATR